MCYVYFFLSSPHTQTDTPIVDSFGLTNGILTQLTFINFILLFGSKYALLMVLKKWERDRSNKYRRKGKKRDEWNQNWKKHIETLWMTDRRAREKKKTLIAIVQCTLSAFEFCWPRIVWVCVSHTHTLARIQIHTVYISLGYGML